jgi:predicted lipoprotein with Yx(FWY)xxD motif
MRTQRLVSSELRWASRWTLLQRAPHLIGLGAVAILAAACSSTTSSTPSTTQPSTSSLAGGSSAVIKTVTVPTYGLILVDSSGMPLYTLSGSCTGGCASAWPALTAPAGTKPEQVAGVTGAIGVAKQADGTFQVTYKGSPLYTFVQDSSGHVTGQGVAGFSVVSVSGSAGSSTTTSTVSRTGY